MTARSWLHLIAVPALVAGTALSGPTFAQEPEETPPADDIPSVSVLPTSTTPDDPNAGQWFVTTLSPTQTGRLTARIFNPASVDQTISLSLADLDFGDDGTPIVADVSDDIGTWGAFDTPQVSVPAGEGIEAGFSITVPEGAEPGDHVGVVLAEGRPQGSGNIRTIKRVATRLYVTVPGDAQPAFVIEEMRLERDSDLFPREVTVTVVLRNTGRVRLRPDVRVNGNEAKGSELLMSRSVEPYTATVSVPWWGGPQRFTAEVTSRTETAEGPARQMRSSMFIVPWVPILLLAALIGLGFLVRKWLRGRVSRYDALQADMRRLEKLLAGQVAAGSGGTPDNGAKAERAIQAALKRAVRAGDAKTEARLHAKLEELRARRDAEPTAAAGDAADGTEHVEAAAGATAAEKSGKKPKTGRAGKAATKPDHDEVLAGILRDIPGAPRARQNALVAAARAYGPRALRKHADLIAALPPRPRQRLQSAARARSHSTKRKSES